MTVETNPCPVCQGDGWYAHPTWADEAKKVVKIEKRPCPYGCPLKVELEQIQ